MGIFLEQVELFNRAPVDLTVQFDGQTKTLKPGANTVPGIVVQYAKNQNPVMGTQDPYNPHVSGCTYLVGVVGSKDNVEPLTAEEWADHLNQPCRENVQQWFADKYGSDPKAKLVTRGKGRATTATSRYDAGSSPQGGLADFSGKQ
jgi:hypothetical protein